VSDSVPPTISPEPSQPSKSGLSSNGAWGVWLSTFVTIFLAEMGDKTQLATMLMAAQSKSPLSVLLGAGTALIATSLVGVLLGRWMSKMVSPKTLDVLAALLMLGIALMLAIEVISESA
jgi:Ca2+/H+ antiporter, TMEM165/GDT1 family